MKRAFAKFGTSKGKKDQGPEEPVQQQRPQQFAPPPQQQPQQFAPPPQPQLKQQQEQHFQHNGGYSNGAPDARVEGRDYDDAQADE